MKSKYYINNYLAVNYNFRRELARSDNTFLMAAPIIDGLPEEGIAIYLSTDGDPDLLATWANNTWIWSIWDEEEAEDGNNLASYMLANYGIKGPYEIDPLMVLAGLLS